jgi:hypothetical protein
MVKPFSPQDAAEAKRYSIPEYVIAAVNELLAKKVNPLAKSQSITLMQNTVIEAIIAKAAEGGLQVTRQYLLEEHYLDFEGVFKASGWNVAYDKPGYCESGEAFWKFSS